MGTWIFGVVMALLSLIGPVHRQPGARRMLSMVGFLLTAFGLAFIFWLIAKNTGHPKHRTEQH